MNVVIILELHTISIIIVPIDSKPIYCYSL